MQERTDSRPKYVVRPCQADTCGCHLTPRYDKPATGALVYWSLAPIADLHLHLFRPITEPRKDDLQLLEASRSSRSDAAHLHVQFLSNAFV